MMGNQFVVLLEPARTVLAQVGQFLVNILLVIIILLIGWVISGIIKTVVTKVLRAVKLDELSDRIELDKLLAKGGVPYSLSELLGVIAYWIGLLLTFIVAVNAVGLTVAADLLNKVVLYVPNIIAAIFILILAMFISVLLKNIVQASAVNAGISQANLLSKIVQIIVMVFAIAIALEQLQIGAEIIKLVISIALGSIGLAVALAFGFGCQGIASKSVSDFLDKLKKK
jgi:hypothetical protein